VCVCVCVCVCVQMEKRAVTGTPASWVTIPAQVVEVNEGVPGPMFSDWGSIYRNWNGL